MKRGQITRTGFPRHTPEQVKEAQIRRTARRTGRAGKDTETAETRLQPQIQRRGKGLKAKADPKLVAWGREVRKRDGNKCQFTLFGPCATGDVRIDPHHIAPRGRRPDLTYVVANGICCCRTHHNWCHDNPREAESAGYLNFDSYELAQKIKAGYVVPGDEDDKRVTL